MGMRRLPWFISVLAALVIAASVFQLSYRYFQSEELSKAEGRLSLYHSTVTAELARFSHLTYVLARDPFVVATAQSGDRDLLNERLKDFAEQAGLDAIYLMQQDGLTISASNAHLESSFIGQNYAFRPYFQDALVGDQGQFYGIGATTGLPGYFIADPVRDGADAIVGVIAIKIDLSQLAQSWRESGEQVLLVNRDGVVLLASADAWQYKTLTSLSADQRAEIEQTRQFPGQSLRGLNWSTKGIDRATIDGDTRLHVIANDLAHGWALHYFTSDDRAATRSWLVTAVLVFVAGLAFIFVQVQRSRRMAVALQKSVQEEAELRRTNDLLAVEIEDRRKAERRLKRTQDELERSSRLAALGQLSASVTHELGQPIAAMRNHIAAAEMGSKPVPEITGKIGGLVDRMEGITRQLKFFARSGTEPFETFDLRDALQAAVALVEPNYAAGAIDLTIDVPDCPVQMRGIKLRIEQVLTNVLRNAADAVEDTSDPSVHVALVGDPVWITVADNGHGLGDATLSDLTEPFVTTRDSGRGMGLGLAISATIVGDHGGTMTAENGTDSGAIFRMTFPNPTEDSTA
jgi:two-component system C4-dicarboxylate transport sensor histidine kinase DctB